VVWRCSPLKVRAGFAKNLGLRSHPLALRKLLVKIGNSSESLCVLIFACPLPEKNLDFCFDIWISYGIRCSNTKTLEKGLISKRALETDASISDKGIEDL